MEWGAKQSRTERFRRQREKVKQAETLHKSLSGLSCCLIMIFFKRLKLNS